VKKSPAATASRAVLRTLTIPLQAAAGRPPQRA